MTFARDVRLAGRQAASDRGRSPARPAGPASLVEHLGTAVGNRSLARLIAAGKLARRPRKRRDPTTADLEEWAKWPNQAHEHWKRLGALERIAVLERMRRRYGKDFADLFRRHADTGKADLDARGCEMPVCMPDQYLKQGYKVADRSQYQIWLVHPSGRWRYLFGGHPTNKPSEPEVPPDVEPPIEEPPVIVDPPPDDLLRTDEPPIDYSQPRP
jgi:hypothetical protein